MALEEYQKKRSFDSTPEPVGEVRSSGLQRFVVQRHQASRLHYDFRLELDGVLKSWAVPKEPPLETGVRRLAVHVEDHPVDYIDFQGVIEAGYGAGTVEIWDRGAFELLSREENRLTFELAGEKMRGPYALIHTGGDKNWILLKMKAPGSKASPRSRKAAGAEEAVAPD